MKIANILIRKAKLFFSIVLIYIIFNFQFNSQTVKALTMNTSKVNVVTEELRLKVPANFKETWLKEEKNVWEPWLSNQEGYLGRQIFWDKEKEEALILVKWKNRDLWKNISMVEVNKIQEQFNENVKRTLETDNNPFKLIYEGELYNQT